jgi:hypothetical protein
MNMTDDQKLAEAQKLLPDGFVIVPRKASAIMAMRGAQARVGWYEPHEDCAAEYFKFDEKGESAIQDRLAPQSRWDDDDREQWLVAKIWAGCIAGMEEWQKRREIDGDTKFIRAWEEPYLNDKLLA